MFGKNKKKEERVSLEEERLQEAIRKDKKWREEKIMKRDLSTETEIWHGCCHLFGIESEDLTDKDQKKSTEKWTQTGIGRKEKVEKMIRKEDHKMYEKLAKQIKYEKKRERVLERKRYLDGIKQCQEQSRMRFRIEMERQDQERRLKERKQAEERQKIYRMREIEAERRDLIRKRREKEDRRCYYN